MPFYNFDERSTKTGTKTHIATGTLAGTSLNYEGMLGNNSSISHPYPYAAGSGWTLNKSLVHSAVCNGSDGTYRYLNYSPYGYVIPSFPVFVASVTVNNALARFNPAKPIVNLPVSIAELRDLPKLFKIAGSTFLKKGGGAYLNFQFGWKPFLSDLKGLLDFQQTTENRLRQLKRLFDRGGSSHRVENGSAEQTTVSTSPPFLGSTIYYRQSGSAKGWLVVKWIPETVYTLNPPSHDELRRRAFRSAYGLNVNISTVWEALPWTWLIDWFSDIGDYLSVSHNSVGFRPGACYQMIQSEARSTNGIIGPHPAFAPNLTVDGPSTVYSVRKTRTVVSPTTISVRAPILSPSQLGILGALALTKS